ncbi:MAG: FtsW/RodA/SpoVE family cell cycle protein, partial [Phycisphaerae bacterium]|nr:FtsW/RodA/SpoVE family cell cycle protein [Phycisphaerae bacterium]
MRNFLTGRLLFVRVCLLASVALLLAVGVLTIYAVGNPRDPSPVYDKDIAGLAGHWQKQLAFIVVAVIGFVAANVVDYRRLGPVSYLIYGGVLLLLMYLVVSRYLIQLPFAAPNRNGVHRWIVLHPSLPRVQPSEFCKLAYILALAWYLRYRSNYRRLRSLVGPFALTLLPMVLILVEPDLGTTLLMMPVFFTMVFIAGARVRHLVLIVLVAILISPAMWFKMHAYQRTRISSVLLQNEWIRQKAQSHPAFGRILIGGKFTERQWQNDWGYHLIRSKFAIASGGPTGRGFGQGPFIRYDFLSERHNDFVFSMVAHQWGFFGSLLFLCLYVVLILCGLEIAAHNVDPFARLVAV